MYLTRSIIKGHVLLDTLVIKNVLLKTANYVKYIDLVTVLVTDNEDYKKKPIKIINNYIFTIYTPL